MAIEKLESCSELLREDECFAGDVIADDVWEAEPECNEGTPSAAEEICNIGANTREQIVRPDESPALHHHGICLCGLSQARLGFRFIRPEPKISQLLVTTRGWGWVYVEGEWVRLMPGMAYATPRDVLHAYFAEDGRPWESCWVTYTERDGHPPVIPVPAPRVIRVDPRPMQAGLAGLYAEARGSADAGMIERWVTLVDMYVRRSVDAWAEPDRLWSLWEAVRMDPTRAWTLPELAKTARVSREVLRQLCRAVHGRSPIEHVTRLRLEIAADRLQRSNETMESVAREFGYSNQFSFSRAFKRVLGVSPSAYRGSSRAGRVGAGQDLA